MNSSESRRPGRRSTRPPNRPHPSRTDRPSSTSGNRSRRRSGSPTDRPPRPPERRSPSTTRPRPSSGGRTGAAAKIPGRTDGPVQRQTTRVSPRPERRRSGPPLRRSGARRPPGRVGPPPGVRRAQPAPETAAAERLQKFLARAGVASRRQCEALITAGRVQVNGEVVRTLGTRVRPGRDRVQVDGVGLRAEAPVILMLHKPAGYITAVSDPEGRPVVLSLLPKAGMPRLFPVGRLDWDTEGLLLLTNDGDLANLLTHPRHGVSKVYHAKVKGRPTAEGLGRLLRGVVSEGERLVGHRRARAADDAGEHLGDGRRARGTLPSGPSHVRSDRSSGPETGSSGAGPSHARNASAWAVAPPGSRGAPGAGSAEGRESARKALNTLRCLAIMKQ